MAIAKKTLGGDNTKVTFGNGGFISAGQNIAQAGTQNFQQAKQAERKLNFEQQKTVTDGLTSGLYSDQFSKEIMNGVGELGALSANSQEYSKKLATLTGNLKYKVDRQAQNTEAWKTQDAALGSEGVGKGYYDDVKKIDLQEKSIKDLGLNQTPQQINESTSVFLNDVNNISEAGRGNISKDFVKTIGNSLTTDMKDLYVSKGNLVGEQDNITQNQFYEIDINGVSMPIFDYKNALHQPVMDRAISSWRDQSKAHDVIMDDYVSKYLAKKEKEKLKEGKEPLTAEQKELIKKEGARLGLTTELGKVFPGYKKESDRVFKNLPANMFSNNNPNPTSAKTEDLVQRFSTITNFNSDVLNNSSLSKLTMSELTGLPQAPEIQGYEVSSMFDDLTVDSVNDAGEKTSSVKAFESLIFDPTSDRSNPVFYAKKQNEDKYERFEGAGIFNAIGEAMQTSGKYKDSDLKKSIVENYGPEALNNDGSINFNRVTKFDVANYNTTKNALADQKILEDTRLRATDLFFNPVNSDGSIDPDAKTKLKEERRKDPVKYFTKLTNVARGTLITVDGKKVRIQSVSNNQTGGVFYNDKVNINYVDQNGDVGVLEELKDGELQKYLQGRGSGFYRDNTGAATTNDMLSPGQFKGILSDEELAKIENEIANN
jgi:hypothetical protein